MWKCKKCDTLNEGTRCTVCGTPCRKPLFVKNAHGQWVSTSDEVNVLHCLAWGGAFTQFIFFFLKTTDVVHPDTGREKIAMFLLNRFLSQWEGILADYNRISLVFNGMSVLYLILAAVLLGLTLSKLSRGDGHGITPLLILADTAGFLPTLCCFTVFRIASAMRSLYGYITFTPVGKLQIGAAVLCILFAVTGWLMSARKEDRGEEEAEEEEFLAIQTELQEQMPEELSALMEEEPEEDVPPEETLPLYRLEQSDRQGEGKPCSRCGRILRPSAIYCNICARPAHKSY